MSSKILIIDDEEVFCEDFAALLRQKGYKCKTAFNGKQGLSVAKEYNPEIVFCDIVMEGKGGMEVLEELNKICPESCIIIITAYGNLDTAVEAFRKGATDYITKPLMIEDVCQKIKRFIEHKRLLQEVKCLRRELSKELEEFHIVGESQAIKDVIGLIKKVSLTKSTVLLVGESGTGKEVAAKTIHRMSSNSNCPFIGINCAGIPEHLLESELFGHIKGAFTGATDNKKGFFETAGEGTIFLDEISSMPVFLQSKLLRVLEEKKFYKVGDTLEAVPFNARVITSTNSDLKRMIKEGAFREDLFFRIKVFEIYIPPLRERKSDIPLLVDYFVKKFNKELKRKCLGVSNETMQKLLLYSWPGNIRELKNVIERGIILSGDDYITSSQLPREIINNTQYEDRDKKSQASLKRSVNIYEKEHIKKVLIECNGNKQKAAEKLGIDPSTLYRKMSKLSLF